MVSPFTNAPALACLALAGYVIAVFIVLRWMTRAAIDPAPIPHPPGTAGEEEAGGENEELHMGEVSK